MTKKILLIEDNEEIRENTAEILELANFQVSTAANGKYGVEKAQTEKPDLIICDIMMPELDGYGVLYLLSKNPDTAAIPFIFLTAKADKADFRKGMELGADDYLTKPFEESELLNAIDSRLKKNQIIRTEFEKSLEGYNEFVISATNEDEFQKLTENRKTKSYKKKEHVYLESNFPKYVYFVNSGSVKTFLTNNDGKEFITGIYGKGDFFGYMSVLEGNEYSDAAATLEDTELCLIPIEEFTTLISKNRDATYKFIKILADNVKEKEEVLLNLAYNSMRKRVAEGLLHYKRHVKGDDDGPESNRLSISREDLANIVGTSRESVIRTLSEFKEEGLLAISGKNITILDLDRLANLKF